VQGGATVLLAQRVALPTVTARTMLSEDRDSGVVVTGKRALTEESPEDLFGLLGIFPDKKNDEKEVYLSEVDRLSRQKPNAHGWTNVQSGMCISAQRGQQEKSGMEIRAVLECWSRQICRSMN
jgi:hypothetical protein